MHNDSHDEAGRHESPRGGAQGLVCRAPKGSQAEGVAVHRLRTLHRGVLPRDARLPAAPRSLMPVPEGQRRTVQVKLRLPPDAAAALRALAEKHGISISEVVARMVCAS